jgi:hypothetical protein
LFVSRKRKSFLKLFIRIIIGLDKGKACNVTQNLANSRKLTQREQILQRIHKEEWRQIPPDLKTQDTPLSFISRASKTNYEWELVKEKAHVVQLEETPYSHSPLVTIPQNPLYPTPFCILYEVEASAG